MTTCSYCGESFDELGTHWRWNPEHRPPLSPRLHEVTTGLLIGDGCINDNGGNANLRVKMITKEFLDHLDKLYGDISAGVELELTAEQAASRNRETSFSPDASADDYSDVYLFRTRNHPDFNEYREWYESGRKEWGDIELTPTILKYWYVCDGGKHQSHIDIALSKRYFNYVQSMLREKNLPEGKTRTHPANVNGYEDVISGRLRFTKSESERLWEYMGEPLPGFGYKWPDEKV